MHDGERGREKDRRSDRDRERIKDLDRERDRDRCAVRMVHNICLYVLKATANWSLRYLTKLIVLMEPIENSYHRVWLQ